jgi:creatinine amidohydrolase
MPSALHLDRLTWPEVQEEIRNGRDMVIVPFGSTEQHGRHLPLATDARIGDALGEKIAARLGAFVAPTVRFGCSEHHLAFAGTTSVSEETFQRVVVDVVESLSRHGFARIVLLPTHGGNFGPLAKAVERVEPREGVRVLAFTDLGRFAGVSFQSSSGFGIDPARAGMHAGEWETSVMLALAPELVKLERAKQGFVGELAEAMAKVFEGIDALDENGVLGDPRPATAEAGAKYIDDIVELACEWVREQG